MSKIFANDPAGSGIYRMVLSENPEPQPLPGQFAMVGVPYQYLPRPFSIEFATDASWAIAYKITGPGTAAMSRMRPGEEVAVDGPLGHGWPMPERDARILLVGGGVGWAPLHFLLTATRRDAKDTCVAVAGRDAAALDWITGRPSAYERRVATEDGSAGLKGRADRLVRKILKDEKYDAAYVCGPDAMMRAVSELTMSAGVKTWVSLEKRMACGAGACKGCQIDGTAGADGLPLHACKDGPVFDASAVYGKVRG